MPELIYNPIQVADVNIPTPTIDLDFQSRVQENSIKEKRDLLYARQNEQFRDYLNAVMEANDRNNRITREAIGDLRGLVGQTIQNQYGLNQTISSPQQELNFQVVPQNTNLQVPVSANSILVASPRDAAYNFGFMMKNGKYYSYKTPEEGARALLNQLQNFITGKSQSAKEYDMVKGFPVGKYRHRGATWYTVPKGVTSYKPFANGQNPNTIGHIWGSGLYAPRFHGGNNPDEYVANLVKWSGIGRDEILDISNVEQMKRLIPAIARMEGNRWRQYLTPEVIASLYE